MVSITTLSPTKATDSTEFEYLSDWVAFAKHSGLIEDVDALAVGVMASAIYAGVSSSKSNLQCNGHNKVELSVSQDIEILLKRAQLIVDAWPAAKREAIEKFLKFNSSRRSDLFASLCQQCFTLQHKKSQGIVFTPQWLAGYVLNEARTAWNRVNDGRVPDIVADVSCGAGVFLAEALNYFPAAKEFIGVDKDPYCVLFSALLSRACKSKWSLNCADALLSTSIDLFPVARQVTVKEVDILVGNPPFVRSQLLDRNYAQILQFNYPAYTKGNYDLSILFLEHALQILKPGGVASYIMSNKFMVSHYGRNICRRLSRDARILSIIDFKDLQLFKDRTTYTCILTFTKLPPARKFLVTNFPNGAEPERTAEDAQTVELSMERLFQHPWNLTGGTVAQVLSKLNSEKHPLLLEVFDDVLQGMRTGANEVFVLQKAKQHRIEADLLLPFVTGEEVRHCRIQADRWRLLFPYERDEFGNVKIIGQERLASNYPKAWLYLQTHRALLEVRNLDSTAHWYAYSRSQNLGSPWQKKIIVKEMMPRSEFAVDLNGTIAFCAGYALCCGRMKSSELCMWAAVLSTPVMEFALRHSGTNLHSGWFRLLKHHLTRIRLPKLTEATKERALQLSEELYKTPGDESLWNRLNSIVAEAFNLTDSDLDVIKSFLAECHKRSMAGIDAEQQYRSIQRRYEPVAFSQYNRYHVDRHDLRRSVTFQINKELPIHRWYAFTQGFSEPLVQSLLRELAVKPGQVVLDPFSGCGTTLVATRLTGIDSVGIEISPFMTWISEVKTTQYKPKEVDSVIAEFARLRPTSGETHGLLFNEYLAKAYSPKILSQLIGIKNIIDGHKCSRKLKNFLLLGLVGIMEEVSQIRKHGSHYRYMLKPDSVGLKKLNIPIIEPNTSIWPIYLGKLRAMAEDVHARPFKTPLASCRIITGDARKIELPSGSCDVVITSPPYLNRNNYIAQQKAEMSVLGFLHDYRSYRELVAATLHSHVENSYGPKPVSKFPEVRRILRNIKMSENNNERIPHMIAGYFDDLDQVMAELKRVLIVGGKCAFVVGNSRWGGVVVPVDHLLLMIAERHGFKPSKVLISRMKGNSPQQMKAYGKISVRESVVIFQKD